MLEINKIHHIDCRAGLKLLDAESVNCIITSPPYWGLRDYGVDGQIGLEITPEQYIEEMVGIGQEMWRVLRKDGTLWINIGDSYAAAPKKRTTEQVCRKSTLQGSKGTQVTCKNQINKRTGTLKRKDLIGIPWALAFAFREAGWYLRQDIIWNKPNPMPESVTDRCTRAHEYLFMFSKSSKYYYDAYAIRTPYSPKTITTFGSKLIGYGDSSGLVGSENRANSMSTHQPKKWKESDKQRGHGRKHAGFNDRWDSMSKEEQQANGANKRSVWTVAPRPFKEAHFATFPPDLIRDAVKAGCPPGGLILDPFMGAGTTALVALQEGYNYIGFELNQEYISIAERRLQKAGY